MNANDVLKESGLEDIFLPLKGKEFLDRIQRKVLPNKLGVAV